MKDRTYKERMKGLDLFSEKQKTVGGNRHNSILPTPEKFLWEHSKLFFFMSTKYEEIGLTRSNEELILTFRNSF